MLIKKFKYGTYYNNYVNYLYDDNVFRIINK